MIRRTSHIVLILALMTSTAQLCPARADDAEVVKEKLFQAKKEYDGEVQKFKQSVEEILDKREALARATGDKKAVDHVKTDREVFTKSGEPPSALPAALRQQIATSRTNLDKAYATALKDFLKMKLDKEAEAVDKERSQFATTSALMFGKRTFLTTLKPFDVKVERDAFVADGKYKMDGNIIPHCIFLHPPARSTSQVNYTLSGKQVALRVSIGVPKGADFADKQVSSPLIFEVLGDGKSLWKSEPSDKFDTFQTCIVNVENIKTLTLRVACTGHNGYAHAVWYEPILAE